jgi:hypothetical protein
MTTLKSQFCITFFEQVMRLKGVMRDHTVPFAVQRATVDYDTRPYMKEILRIIFHTPTNNDGREDYDLISAERLLIQDGFDQRVVKRLTKEIMDGCVDTLVAYIPHLTYDTDQEIKYVFFNEFDVIVTVEDHVDEIEEAYRGA